MNFAIIIPTRNEKANLEKLLPFLSTLYPDSPVWIVDDNSRDGTGAFIKEFSKNHPFVHALIRQNKRGRGSAVLEGLKEAFQDKKSDYFLEMDADFSHDPKEIRKLLDEIDTRMTGPDINTVIIGSRHINGAKFINCSKLRVFLSHLANWYARLILGIPIKDYTNGFRLYPRRAVEVLKEAIINQKGYIVLSETAYILYKNGFSFQEVPTIFVNRTVGRSNATIFEFLRSIPAIIKIKKNH